MFGLFTSGCKGVPSNIEDTTELGETFVSKYGIGAVSHVERASDGCEYWVSPWEGGLHGHKGDCDNPIHIYKDTTSVKPKILYK